MERTSDFRNLTRKKGGKDQQINFIFQSTKYARKSLFIENAFEIVRLISFLYFKYE